MEAPRNRMVNVLLTPRQQYTVQDLHSNMAVSHMVGMCHMCMWRLLVCKIDLAECMLHEVHIV
jgi:hypothetical protein